MAASRRLVAGTGWKMNNDAAATRHYAADLYALLADRQVGSLELYVLPPFTSLHAAAEAFGGDDAGEVGFLDVEFGEFKEGVMGHVVAEGIEVGDEVAHVLFVAGHAGGGLEGEGFAG